MINALIVVDMQNLFVDLVGEQGTRAVNIVNRYVSTAVDSGDPVFYTRDYAPIELPENDPEKRTQLHADLDIRGTIVDKGPGKSGNFSGFLHAPVLRAQEPYGGGSLGMLVEALRRSAAQRVTVVGIAADVCVAATAMDAMRLGYPTTIPLEATAFVHVHPDGDQAAVADLRAAGISVLD